MYIYKITNIVNGKIYVGKTVKRKIATYWNNAHVYKLRKKKHHNKYLQASWNKYGEASFTFEVVEKFDSALNFNLNNLEKYWIKNLDSMNPKKGYNLTVGGEGITGWRHSPETRQKISEAHKGKKHLSGKDHPMYGRTGSTNPFFGKEHTKEFMDSKRKRIKGLNLVTLVEVCFNSIADAAKFVKGQIGHVCSVCKNERKSHKGWKFEYIQGTV